MTASQTCHRVLLLLASSMPFYISFHSLNVATKFEVPEIRFVCVYIGYLLLSFLDGWQTSHSNNIRQQ